MLYIWACFTFFSFPLLYPYLISVFVPERFIPLPLRNTSIHQTLPRARVVIPLAASMLVIVYHNTLVHPFTLADNRHYVFYVFRILLRQPIFKFLAVPVYLICGWASISVLGMSDYRDKHTLSTSTTNGKGNAERKTPSNEAPSNRASFVLIWLTSTTLSLVTAPLVEPRYFIVPWAIWRIHVRPLADQKSKSTLGHQSSMWTALRTEVPNSQLWMETLWYICINIVTGYVFLYRGFEWTQEPGKTQRFMW